MKKIVTILMAALCVFMLAACSGNTQSEVATEEMKSVEGAESHKIGVLVYNIADEEVIAFRDYLENYIAEVYPGVTFIYSESINSQEEEMAYIQQACDEGADGILSFNSYDLKAEVDLCAQNQVYYMMASGSVSDEAYDSVCENEYFVGVIGPGSDLEYNTASDMAEYFVGQKYGDEYFILSGGSNMGNEMHLQRTVGILDKLQEMYGVTFDQTSEEIALSQDPIHVESGSLKVCVTPGYLDFDVFFDAAKAEYEEDHYSVVLSVLPIVDMSYVVKGAKLGIIDSYNTRNLQLFTNGQLNYVAGKYSSIIGPSFAAMYNAISGYAEDFREDGKAFRLTQGFWSSSDAKDYEEKYNMANSVVMNAYNYEDLGKVCKTYNPDATLEDLKELAGAYTYEDALARRSEK